MNGKRWVATLILIGLVWALADGRAGAGDGPHTGLQIEPLGTAFTYQGRLTDAEGLVDRACDFRFQLLDRAQGGTLLGTQVVNDLPVRRGLFTVPLDFGDAWNGQARWLEVMVTCGGPPVTLTPRQELTPAPYAVYAAQAGAVPWAGIGGMPAGFADGTDADRLAELSCALNQIPKWTGSAWNCRDDEAGGAAWLLTGNVGTNPAANYLGTLDNQPLELRVNGLRVLRLEPAGTSPNLLGGYADNRITAGVVGATIAGGGQASGVQQVTGSYGAVGGGRNNQAGSYGAVGGGDTNVAGELAAAGGGVGNDATGRAAVAGGGQDNTADGQESVVVGGMLNQASGLQATIGGGAHNLVSAAQATVAGGESNQVTGLGGAVGGGRNNDATGEYAAAGGGDDNLAAGSRAAVGGGQANQATGAYASVGGGRFNRALANYGSIGGGGGVNDAVGNRVTDDYGSVGGGGSNVAGNGEASTADATYATVGGGLGNDATAGYATIGGGQSNTAAASSATVAGGDGNAATAATATVGGGVGNDATAVSATVAGGEDNVAANTAATVGGGDYNQATGYASAIAGGYHNLASAHYTFVAAGTYNEATAAHALAAGRRAKARGAGTFVWADNENVDLVADATSGSQMFLARANGGFWFGQSEADRTISQDDTVRAGLLISTTTGAGLTLGGVWTDASDRAAKENFAAVDGAALLARLAGVPVGSWNFIAEGAAVRHIGPTAQDFYAAFGLGTDERHLAALDANGVALAAIQALYAQNRDLAAENAALRAGLDALAARLAALEGRTAVHPYLPDAEEGGR